MSDEDRRSIPELIAASLEGAEDDESAWAAIRELHRRGEGSFEAAAALTRSPLASERGRGVDILAQLGSPNPSEALRSRCADVLLRLLEGECEPSVLSCIGVALGHLCDPRAVAGLIALRTHPDAEVRLGVVWGLTPHAEPQVVSALIELSADADDEVRNWATFGLGSQLEEIDTPQLRDALLSRLGDSVQEIRGEGLIGLARRRDMRVLDPLRDELAAQSVGILAVEAAEVLGDRSLLPLLVELRDSPGEADEMFVESLERAIAALRKPPSQSEPSLS